jgi:hypothetical protein
MVCNGVLQSLGAWKSNTSDLSHLGAFSKSKNGKKGITQLRNISICKQDGLQKHLRHGSSHSSLAAKHQHRR